VLDPLRRLLPTLHEDDRMIAVCKPPGIDSGVLPGGGPGAAELLARQRGLADDALVPANRLSRYDSGVLVLVRDDALLRHVRAGLRRGRIQQVYELVAKGSLRGQRLELRPAGSAPAGTGPKRNRRPAGKPHPEAREPTGEGIEERPTIADLRVLHRGGDRLHIRCDTNARSTHELRAMLRAAGLHVFGDTMGGRPGRDQSVTQSCTHLSRFAFHHPALGRKLTISAPPAIGFQETAEGDDPLQRRLVAALAARLECLQDESTNAVRLLNGAADGVPGLVVERLDHVLIVQVLEDHCTLSAAEVRRVSGFFRDWFGASAVYRKRFPKDRASPDPRIEAELSDPQPMLGTPAPAEIEIRERGVTFVVRPYDGYSTGLFLDHRDNRARVRDLADGRRVLNLFAYTCGFSVAAALGGAARTVSVDLSRTHLERGKEHFRRNGLALDEHTFVASEAFDYFKRAQRQGRTFDFVILDPPTFARLKRPRRTFNVQRDLPALVAEASRLLEGGGILMVSTNCRQMTRSALQAAVRAGLERRAKVLAEPPLPPDFASDPDFAKTVFLRVT